MSPGRTSKMSKVAGRVVFEDHRVHSKTLRNQDCQGETGWPEVVSANMFMGVFSPGAEHFQPKQIVRSLIPSWNTLVFFEVSPVSFHQVKIVSHRCESTKADAL